MAPFFGVGAVVAAGIVPPERRAAAVAAMFSGLTIATIGGVPLAAWVGEMLGWARGFLGHRRGGAVAMLSLRLALQPLEAEAGGDMRAELRVLMRGPVLAALALTVLGASAMFTVFTYIVPILRIETGAATPFVTAMLVLYGIGLTVGNWPAGASPIARWTAHSWPPWPAWWQCWSFSPGHALEIPPPS